MSTLTNAQLGTLKTYINSIPEWASLPMTNASGEIIREALNQLASPDWIVEKTQLSRHSILAETSIEGTTFTWTGGAYITRSQGERDAFREMFNSTGTVDPRLATIKAAFADIFSGTGGATNRTHITALSKRKATLGEKVLSTGTGSLASPAQLGWEGQLTVDDVVSAREYVG